MSWAVWEAPAYDGLIAYGHDDLLMNADLCAILDAQPWPGAGKSTVVHRDDLLADIDTSD
jgi:selenophosphate synthetase-related protein